MFAGVVDGANIGMVECGCGLRLTLETTQGLTIAGNVVRQELEHDEAM